MELNEITPYNYNTRILSAEILYGVWKAQPFFSSAERKYNHSRFLMGANHLSYTLCGDRVQKT